MIALLKRWVAELAMPKDPNFKHRVMGKKKLGHLFIVELGASDYVIIHDMLGKIQTDDTDEITKSRELMGLRYMALAMSLRTRFGKMPFDWQNDVDLMYLATLPHSKVIPALDEIAAISGIEWITPSYAPKHTDEQPVEVEQPNKKRVRRKPLLGQPNRRFALRLAQKNGAPNVDDMLMGMSSTQFIEWQRFAQLEPFGAQADEFQIAALRALVTNYLSSNKQNINEFMLTATTRPKEHEKTVEEIYHLFG